jgi:hypothetical protein
MRGVGVAAEAPEDVDVGPVDVRSGERGMREARGCRACWLMGRTGGRTRVGGASSIAASALAVTVLAVWSGGAAAVSSSERALVPAHVLEGTSWAVTYPCDGACAARPCGVGGSCCGPELLSDGSGVGNADGSE